jgi:prepilin-type N-terminal cleavage/methylation domain-containing protein
MKHRSRVRGFTLVELMVVVVILGVLAVLALFAYRKYTYAARNSEAVQFLGGVRAAQESYFQSFGQYCGTLNRPCTRR